MHLFLLGVSHQTAPVELRERLDFQARGLDQALQALAEPRLHARGGRALDVQPRRALRGLRRHGRRPPRTVLAFLSEFHRVAPAELEPHLFEHDRPRRRAAPVPRRRRPRLPRRRRAADPRPGEGGARRRPPSHRCGGPAAQPAVPLVVRRRQARAHRRRRSARAPCRSASPPWRSPAKSSATSKGRRVLVVGAGEMGKLTARHLKAQGVAPHHDHRAAP